MEKKPRTKKASDENAQQIFAQQETPDNTDAKTTQDNWNFYNGLQNVYTQKTNGGTNMTASSKPTFRKRRNKAKTQRNSRRINRKRNG